MAWRRLFAVAIAWAAVYAGPAQAQYAVEDAPLSDWAVGILAADWRDGAGAAIDAFDNASRDLAESLADAGFRRENIAALSLRPMSLGGDSLRSEDVYDLFAAQAERARAGCLLYFTSHGSPEGIVIGTEGLLSPARMNGLIGDWCGQRPTVVVVSACYSGVFVPVLSAPNRMILSAARADRVSFGCSADADYPYFDGCVLAALPYAEDFVHLSSLTRRCVAGREKAERLTPPSGPLTQIGADVEDLFVFLNFERETLAQGDGAGAETLP